MVYQVLQLKNLRRLVELNKLQKIDYNYGGCVTETVTDFL